MKTTCGVFLFDKYDRILIVHPNGEPYNKWSIPKGIKEKNETDWEAAKREVKEETNIDLNSIPIKFYDYIGVIPYKNKKKILSAFIVNIDMELPEKYLKCTSKFTCKTTGNRFVEVDNHQWVYIDIALNVINKNQKQLYLKHYYYKIR